MIPALTTYMKKVLLLTLALTFYVFSVYANTCASTGSGDWNTSASWSCNTGVGNFPNGSWANGQYLIIGSGHTINIPNNITIDLRSSNLVELRIRGTLEFNANSQLRLPAGATVVLENGASIKASNNSNGTLIEIGGNGVWGRSCEGDGCSNDQLTGPGSMDQNSNPSSPLPVVLVKFESKVSVNGVNISWATASEKDFDYFSIQRSRNAKDYEEVGTVKGAGYNTTEIKNYTFADENPLSGRVYYRLKAVDLDGTYEIFDAIMVNNNSSRTQALQVYPNPLSGSDFSIITEVKPSAGATIKVTDIRGSEIFSAAVNELNNYQINTNFPAGIYIVILNDHGVITKSRIVKN